MFRIEMLPAAHGDCLWIEYGSNDQPNKILIDTGPVSTYGALRERIKQVPKEQRQLDLFVMTHIDEDHIEAGIKLLNLKRLEFSVKEVWFNGWKHLWQQQPDVLGAVQGEYFSGLVEKHKIPWNTAFAEGPVVIPSSGSLPLITLPGGMKLTLLSPDTNSLKSLAEEWKKTLAGKLQPGDLQGALLKLEEQKKYIPNDMLGSEHIDIGKLAATKFKSDDSATNASSIAFLAEYGTKKALFLGDGHAPRIIDGLQRLVTERGINKLSVDAVKLPHHASKNNTSKELLSLIKSPRYLVSTNGAKIDHPDAETIARVIVCAGGKLEICFNYLSDSTKMWKDVAKSSGGKFTATYPADGTDGLLVEL
jgi:beta-lactamase superfamily II metal-dependent hydrolase